MSESLIEQIENQYQCRNSLAWIALKAEFAQLRAELAECKESEQHTKAVLRTMEKALRSQLAAQQAEHEAKLRLVLDTVAPALSERDAAVAEAIERAAKECEREASLWKSSKIPEPDDVSGGRSAAFNCAIAIRALSPRSDA